MNETYSFLLLKFQVVGYKGRAVVVVSLVTSEPPYKPHPHNLVGKEGCSKGVCTIELDSDTMSCSFPSLGIQCVKKKEIEESLKLRQQIRVDPFQSKFRFTCSAHSKFVKSLQPQVFSRFF
jgi:c-Rel proto-oncogene protein